MKNELTKESVICNKKEAIKALNKMLECYINDSSEQAQKHLKKANLISYWLKDYVKLINFEEKFNPCKNIAYKRGNIVKLNFGFNIGSEYGGLHYGVVLDNNNSHNSPVITVIPLTSAKEGKNIHSNSVDLGNELYKSLKLKYDTILRAFTDEDNETGDILAINKRTISLAKETFEIFEKTPKDSPDWISSYRTLLSYIDAAEKLNTVLENRSIQRQEEETYLNKIGDEIAQMKEGSIALVNQITTVSKMRIFDPRNLKGVLSGISLSPTSMDKINDKVKELYIF